MWVNVREYITGDDIENVIAPLTIRVDGIRMDAIHGLNVRKTNIAIRSINNLVGLNADCE
jgi:hypothetical protein